MTAVLPPSPEFGAPVPQKPSEAVLAFLAERRSASAVNLHAPGPDADQLADLLRLATRVPDHGKLAPWRFILLDTDAKAVLVQRLDALARGRGDEVSAMKLAKLRIPPLCVAVISAPKPAAIDAWEQILSAGVVCANLLYAATAMGFGANWITDWYAYDPDARTILGLAANEQVAGFILMGTASDAPLERVRPDLAPLITRWTG